MGTQPLFTDHDSIQIGPLCIKHFHKVLGLACIVQYLVRFGLLCAKGNMGFDPSYWSTWATPAVHLFLSCSSFIFPVPERRFGSKPIIWKELQIHNILFTLRSCLIFYFWLVDSCSTRDAGFAHWCTRLLLVVGCHYAADECTGIYEQEGRTTTRDMPWSPGVPEDRQRIFKKYYAVCQLFATAALLGQGLQTLDGAFAIMWPIQISTFLMTLVRKNMISGSTWHYLYAGSLGMIFLIPVVTVLREMGFYQDQVFYGLVKTGGYIGSTEMNIAKFMQAPVAAILRLRFRWNKWAVFFALASTSALLSEVERSGMPLTWHVSKTCTALFSTTAGDSVFRSDISGGNGTGASVDAWLESVRSVLLQRFNPSKAIDSSS